MNLKTLFLTVTILIGFNSYAQNEFKVGAKAGANYSGFHANGSSSYTDAFGFLVGLVGDYKLSDKITLQLELLFNQKTGALGTTSDLPDGLIRSDLTYIDLPIALKYYFLNNLSLDLGPQIDLLMSDKTTFEFYNDDSDENSVDIDTNSVQFSLNLGLSYTFSKEYLLQIRYSHGLSNIFDNLDAKNSVFALSLGYFFL